MNPIIIPDTYNYIAVFLTLKCNLHCLYCINKFESNPRHICEIRLSGEEWVGILDRIQTRPDLPVTLQGGEPSFHPDFFYILSHVKKDLPIDILTNLQFDIEKFKDAVPPKRLRRAAPYASIRVSFHPSQMKLLKTIDKVRDLLEAGYNVGVWVVDTGNKWEMQIYCDAFKKYGIDFRVKEFLGERNGKLHGTYKYENACSKQIRKVVLCKTSELIIGPDGKVFRCHADLYENRLSIGYVFDGYFEIESKEDMYRSCTWFGHCNPCDLKIKFNRFQQPGHCSVDIKFEDE